MKKIFIIAVAFGIAFLYSAGTIRAQGCSSCTNSASTTVNETATISQPIRLYKNTDLNFGGIISGVSQGNVHVFGTIGALTIPISGNPTGATTTTVTYPGTPGPSKFIGSGYANVPAQVSSFIVTGEPGLSYTISVSGGTSVKTGNGDPAHTMNVTLDNPSGGNVNNSGAVGILNTSGDVGTDKFTIGGVLTVKAAQLSGIYTGSFNVSVCYN